MMVFHWEEDAPLFMHYNLFLSFYSQMRYCFVRNDWEWGWAGRIKGVQSCKTINCRVTDLGVLGTSTRETIRSKMSFFGEYSRMFGTSFFTTFRFTSLYRTSRVRNPLMTIGFTVQSFCQAELANISAKWPVQMRRGTWTRFRTFMKLWWTSPARFKRQNFSDLLVECVLKTFTLQFAALRIVH